jgi:hypothetical protein
MFLHPNLGHAAALVVNPPTFQDRVAGEIIAKQLSYPRRNRSTFQFTFDAAQSRQIHPNASRRCSSDRAKFQVSFDKRNRIVSIRVTQGEYETLERISREQGANSVSEFLRRVLTNSALANLTAEPEADGVLTQVAALKRKVDWLSNIVEQRHKDSRPE